jgi:SWI/SNF-related matrix-associated actin-dependent regulator 1 of chromatin subfamily A
LNYNEIKPSAILKKLSEYSGENSYIIKLKNEYLKYGKIELTDVQKQYIKKNYDFIPVLLDKIIEISDYYGEQLKDKYDLEFTPKKIKLHKLLAETEKAYHCLVMFTTKQKFYTDLFVPKSQILDDIFKINYSDVELDFDSVMSLDKRNRILFDYQKYGIKFLHSNKGCILGDEMGTGKTMMSIAAALLSGYERILVICPAALKLNWKREIECFTNDVSVIKGYDFKVKKFTIINYDILKNYYFMEATKEENMLCSELVKNNFDLIICDEAHSIKDKDSIRGSIVKDLCSKYGDKAVWLLTGTPVANRPKDFYNLLKVIKHPITENFKYYATRYCEGKQITKTVRGRAKKIWLMNGASNLDELSKKTTSILLRRLKKDILDLPEKTVTPLYYELSDSQRRDYNNLWDEYLEQRELSGKRGNVAREMVELSLLKKYIANIAVEKTIELAETIIDSGEKVIIFCNYDDELYSLKEHFKNKAVIHNGKMNERDRQESIDRFQNDDKIKVFIGNIISAGTGITLTNGVYTIFNSFHWTPGINAQAEDRNHRLGVKKNVTIYYMLFEDTISERIWATLRNKKNVINQILNEDSNTYDDELVDYCLKE